MRVAVTFRNLDSSDAIKTYAHDKIAKLQKYLRAPIDAQVIASLEKKHRHCVEISLTAGAVSYVGREESEDMYASIDMCLDKLEKQITRSKARITRKRRSSPRTADVAPPPPAEANEE